MKRQVDWNKDLYEKFCERAMLSSDEREILKRRIMGIYVSTTARELDMAESTVHRKIAILKKKYDEIQKYYDDMPIRRESEAERIMDSN